MRYYVSVSNRNVYTDTYTVSDVQSGEKKDYHKELRIFRTKSNALGRMDSINQSINTFITRHGTEARATVRIMPKQREMS